MSKTISDIIELAGGPAAIAKASASGKAVTIWGVHRWRRNGIRDVHWPMLIELSLGRVSVDDLYAANRALEKGRRRPVPLARPNGHPAAA